MEGMETFARHERLRNSITVIVIDVIIVIIKCKKDIVSYSEREREVRMEEMEASARH